MGNIYALNKWGQFLSDFKTKWEMLKRCEKCEKECELGIKIGVKSENGENWWNNK